MAMDGELFCLDSSAGLKTLWREANDMFHDHVTLIAGPDRVLVGTIGGDPLLPDATAPATGSSRTCARSPARRWTRWRTRPSWATASTSARRRSWRACGSEIDCPASLHLPERGKLQWPAWLRIERL